MDISNKPKDNVLPFQGRYNTLSPYNLENIMEDLGDMGYLSGKGKEFRYEFWKMFIEDNYD